MIARGWSRRWRTCPRSRSGARNLVTPDQRRKWNHPTTVVREWKKAKLKEFAGDDDVLLSSQPPKEKIRALKHENRELRNGAPLPWAPTDSAADKARAVLEQMDLDEAYALGLALLDAVEQARKHGR